MVMSNVPRYADIAGRKSADINKLMKGINDPESCARRSQELVRDGKPREGYLILVEGMRRFEGQAPSLLPLYKQYQRGHLSELIREQNGREQEGTEQ
jgi:hypothetical protein